MIASKLQLDFSSYLNRHDLDGGGEGGQGGGGRPPGTGRELQPPGVDTSGGSGGRPAGTGGDPSGGSRGGGGSYDASVAHGYSFENTYREDEVTKTIGKVLHSVVFDHDYHFAGLQFKNVASGIITSDNMENS